MHELSINLLGRTKINYHGDNIESKMSTKAIALICYLISNCDKKISREKLSGNLWSDSDEKSSRYNLRFCLWSIKRIIHPDKYGEEFIICEKELCYINKRYNFFCDVLCLKQNEMEIDLSLEKLLELKTYYSGEFLEGLYINRASEFNDFVIFERIVFQNKNIELLKRILNKYTALEQYKDSIGILKEMLSIDPYNEDFVCMLMDAYFKSDNLNGAILYYQNFEKYLRKNLNVSPSKKLKTLYETLVTEKKEIYGSTEKAQGDIDKPVINISSFCLKEIPFFWIADTVGKIVDGIGDQRILVLEGIYAGDLASIQNKILLLSDEKIHIADSVPSVRIINAFCELLRCVASKYNLTISIDNVQNIDNVSKDALQYIENCSIADLKIIRG